MVQPIELMTSSALEPARPRLLDQVRRKIRINHYSRATEKTYVYWIRYFILHITTVRLNERVNLGKP
jgi:hypothetical protein